MKKILYLSEYPNLWFGLHGLIYPKGQGVLSMENTDAKNSVYWNEYRDAFLYD